METKRSYRHVEPSDLPRIQAGKLKVFSTGPNGGLCISATLASTNMTYEAKCLWIIHYSDGDRYRTDNETMVVDVTPEKRYAVWNHKTQRFQCCNEHGGGYKEKFEAEAYIDAHTDGMSVKGASNFYVVEWEIKDHD